MGVISDAIDSLQDWVEDLFRDGIKSQFDSISSLLTDTFDNTTCDGGLVQTFITGHPASFTGNAAGTGTHVWNTIETLCNSVVVPIGGFILTIVLLNDLIQTVLRGNNFKDFDDSIFIKWIIKALCGVLLVSNVFYIASALFSFGTNVCSNGLTTLLGNGSYLDTALSLQKSALNDLNFGELMTVWFISLIVHLGMMILIVAIVITLASRIIEVFMYLGVAPIPIATMMNEGEWSSIGKNWIKQLLALSFQGFFIIIALGIFKTLFANVIATLNTGDGGIIMQMAMLLGYTAALIFTILRTGAISKSVFNYYDFDFSNGDIKYWCYSDGTETLLQELFDSQYQFEYHYDNTSHWEYKNSFVSRGYYSIEGSGVSGDHGYVTISYPDALPFSGYNNDKTIYFDLSNSEVLNYNNGYSATGWYLKNQYVDDYDPNGTKYGAWYTNGEACSYGIYIDDVLTIPIPYVIPSESWCSFLQKYDWVEDCRLYYNVKQKKTFDEAITDKLNFMSHADERVAYYNLLAGNDTATMYGNHQTLKCIAEGATIRNYSLNREFGYQMTAWNFASDGLYEGIKVSYTSGSNLYAPFDCKITDVDTSNHKITLRKDDVMYWYDGTGGTKRDTEVYITNADLTGGLSNCDTIKSGDVFAVTTSGEVNVEVKIDTDGEEWDFVDPRLVFY